LLERVFEQAGDDMDVKKITALHSDSSSKAKQLTQLNTELKRLSDCQP